MILEPELNAIVIIGIWNKSIFTEDWMKKYIFPEEANIQVEVPLQLGNSLRFSTEEFRFFINGDHLRFAILKFDDSVFEKVGRYALKIVDALQHTPLLAFGINFNFLNEKTDQLPAVFDGLNDTDALNNLNLTPYRTEIIRTIPHGQCDLNLSISKADENFLIKFNYHHKVDGILSFRENFEAVLPVELKHRSVAFLEKLYGLHVNF